MVAEENGRSPKRERRDDFPSVDLDCAVDESSDPPQVTIFDPDSERVGSAWITADGDVVTSLERLQ